MLGPHAPQTVGTDKRTEPRYGGCRRLVRVRRAMASGAPFRLAIVQNVSMHGIGLLLTEPVPLETMLEIEMHGQARFARVVHSTKQADGWLVGCSLNNSLSDGDLERFLT